MPHLDHIISVVPRATEHRPTDHVPIRQALDEIKGGRYRSYVERVRATDDKERRRKAKASGPAYAFCGRFSYVSRDRLVEPSGVVCLDYDGLHDVAEARARIAASPHTLAVFASVSGELSAGLKVLVPVTPAPTTNEENHAAYEAAAALWGLDADSATKDISRLCYTSYDPALYVNPAAEPVRVDYSAVPRKKRKERGEGEITVLPDGQKYEMLRDLGGVMRYAGYSADLIETALQALRERHGESPGEAEPVAELARWLGEQEPGPTFATFRANVIKESAAARDTADVTGLSQLSQRHKGGEYEPNGAIRPNGAVTNANGAVTTGEKPKPTGLLATVDARDFIKREFPPIRWLVQNVMPEGLSMLAGKPKTGKSFVAVNVAVAVACGGKALGKLDVDQGRALYVNLDSSPREFQKRLKAFEDVGDLELAFSWPKLHEGGLDQLAEFVERRGDVRLIVIDTLKHVRQPDDPKRRLYDQDYESLMGLAEIARAHHGLGILVIHHANKIRDAEDPFDMISGSTGLTAALDTGMVLRQIAEGTALYVKGKEIAGCDLALTWDERLMTWVYAGPAEAFNLNETKQAVLDAVRVGQSTPRDVADFTGLDYGNVRQAMVRMAAGGQLRRTGRGTYDVREIRDVTEPLSLRDND